MQPFFILYNYRKNRLIDMASKLQFSKVSFAATELPSVTESQGRKWVEYGDDNDFFNYIIKLYSGSAVHAAICNMFQLWIHGGGLTVKSGNSATLPIIEKLFKEKALQRFEFDYKLQGQAAFEIIWSIGSKKVVEIWHMPIERLRPECEDENGNINHYYYSKDWTNVRKYKPFTIPTYTGEYKGNAKEVLVIKNYCPGLNYFGAPDYIAAAKWIDIDSRVANFHQNNIANGFAPSMVFAFNNGVPEDEETIREVENRLNAKFGGDENAGKVIILWNENKETGVDITTAPISDSDKQYQFIAEHSRSQIIVGHKVTSPMLLGIKQDTGLGNNADEIKNATLLFQNTVIKPLQDDIIEAVEFAIKPNGYEVDLGFIPYTPIEFTDKVTTPINQSKFSDDRPTLEIEVEKNIIAILPDLGEKIDANEWELIDESDVIDSENESNFEALFNAEFSVSPDGFDKANQPSRLDGKEYRIRYQYSRNISKNSRDFCRTMVGMSKAGTVYRIEDIDAMSAAGVNGEFSERGRSTYDVFKYKGGCYCAHFWRRLVFVKQGAKDKAAILKSVESVKQGIERTATNNLPNRGKVN